MMTEVYDIIQELNEDNGSNYKMNVLRKYADNETLQMVLKMAYDSVAFTYGISMKNVTWPDSFAGTLVLDAALSDLRNLYDTREYTGNEARNHLESMLSQLSEPNAIIIKGIINRDLRINMGRSNINKVFKGLIVKPVYMRCGLYGPKTAKKINPEGAFVQLKADGTYREFTVMDGEVSCNSRSGEEYEYPVIYEELSSYPDGKYIGELTVIIDGVLQDRATGNGLINSDNPPHADIYLDTWDYVTLDEYAKAANKVKGTTPYFNRFERLNEIVGEGKGNVRVIETHVVNTIQEALQWCSHWMNLGFEGAILKDSEAIFRDGTSPQQLKLKLSIDIDVRITGFIEGTPGTKREETFGSMTFATDDGKIKGSCSGFTDDQLKDFNSRREELVKLVMTVQCNDITQGRENDYFALSHPRFIEIRYDKTDTDTLERALKTKQMAMMIGEV